VHRKDKESSFEETFEEKILGKTLATDLEDTSGNIIAQKDDTITHEVMAEINAKNIDAVNIRSVLTCQTEG